MSKTTVRSILAMILENGLQMDDVISFDLSEESNEVLGTSYDINFARTETYSVRGIRGQKLSLIFDLNDITEEN